MKDKTTNDQTNNDQNKVPEQISGNTGKGTVENASQVALTSNLEAETVPFLYIVPTHNRISVEETLELLLPYYNNDKDTIYEKLPKLANAETDKVQFAETHTSSGFFITIHGSDKEGKSIWETKLNPTTAQPEQKKEVKKQLKFEETIELGKEYSREEAIEKLRTYHNTKRKEAILYSFNKLKDTNTDIVTFTRGTGDSADFIVMQGFKEANKSWLWYSYIRRNGQPQSFWS